MKKSQHNTTYKKLITELKIARLAKGLTQKQVAYQIDKHPPFINKIESGERRIDVVELSQLCRLYGIKLTSLLKRAGLV